MNRVFVRRPTLTRSVVALGLALLIVQGVACSALDQWTLPPGERDRAPTATPRPDRRRLTPGDWEGEISSGGQTRTYRLHVPRGYRPEQPAPLVFAFHGLGQSPAQLEASSGLSEQADEAGFVVVYPSGRGNPVGWAIGVGRRSDEDVGFVRDLIAYLESELSIDRARVYATGISNGGGMTNQLGCQMADTFAAIAPVAGSYVYWQDCQPSRPVPVLAFRGTDDYVVPYGGKGRLLPPVREWVRGWAERNGCDSWPRESYRQAEATVETWGGCRGGASVTLYSIEGGGHAWPGARPSLGPDDDEEQLRATGVIWRFFAAHSLPDPA